MKERFKRPGLWSLMICLLVLIGGVTSQAVAQTSQMKMAPGMPFIAETARLAPIFEVLTGAIPDKIPYYQSLLDPTGQISSYQPNAPYGTPTAGNGFFTSTGLTANGRSCFVCHQPQNDWEIVPSQIMTELITTSGRSPLFQGIDSAVCPDSPLLSAKYPNPNFIKARIMLFTRGDFRIAINAPYNTSARGYTTFDGNTNPEWKMKVLKDPYGCEMDPTFGLPNNQLSVYRRPLNAANLAFLARVEGSAAANPNGSPFSINGLEIMWDAREPDLGTQFIDATLFHGQAASAPLVGAGGPVNTAVDFQSGIFTAQTYDFMAGDLTNKNGTGPLNALLGGPVNLYNLSVALRNEIPNISPVPGFGPFGITQAGFYGELIIPSVPNFVAAIDGVIPVGGTTPTAFTTDFYSTFAGSSNARKASIARGEVIFNTRTFTIYDEPGVNLALGNPAKGSTCATCHGGVYVGNDAAAPLHRNGIMDNSNNTSDGEPLTVMAPTPDFPLFAFYCSTSTPIPFFQHLVNDTENCPGGVIPCNEFITTDPGRGLVTGKCADLGQMKTPIMRGVGARAPYFHGGQATTLLDAVNFYNNRFNIGLSAQDKQDLVNYLNTL